MQEKKFYRLTAEGRSLWARRESVRLPLDYRRILGLVDFTGHPEVIHSYLARYPRQLVDEWLSEFEALRLIESITATPQSLSEIARKTEPPPLELEDMEQLEPEVSFADISLTRLGLYVAYERIANRPVSQKTAAETLALVVEDDPDQLALAVQRLTVAGYPVRTADGVQALYREPGARPAGRDLSGRWTVGRRRLRGARYAAAASEVHAPADHHAHRQERARRRRERSCAWRRRLHHQALRPEHAGVRAPVCDEAGSACRRPRARVLIGAQPRLGKPRREPARQPGVHEVRLLLRHPVT